MINDEQRIQVELEEKLKGISREFIDSIASGTDDPNNFISINEIESELDKALKNTKIEYLKSLKECLSNLDESQIIKLKKENS